jgi:DnaK suppressor protein
MRAAHHESISYNFQGDTTMAQLDTTPFKAQLLAQRTSLLGQLAILRGGNLTRAEASAEHFAQRADSQAQTTTEKDLEFALDARETEELTAVEAALQRIAFGTYGECTDCGTHIAPARLQASPEAPRCIHCQENAER